MSILVYAESWEGKFRKNTLEAISYAKKTSSLFQTDVKAVTCGIIDNNELERLGEFGANKVVSYPNIIKSDGKAVASILQQEVEESQLIIFSNTFNAKIIASRISSKLKAGLVTNVISYITNSSDICVKKQSFSSKAIETVRLKSKIGILSLSPNAFEIKNDSVDVVIEVKDQKIDSEIIILGKDINKGKISLSEAEIVVSAGRGLKAPENWGMVEELAEILGAATACSKPVSDIGWRPHSEHVGQTGKAIAPNLYIAIGISGAIQHLAGVNSSKVMVVINTDPEAPFFKAADYGIIGDAFEVVPKLIEEFKNLKDN
ncbi:MAG: electron transfer flavoprotein subunit alpha/FixB family protein [Flavobacteriales bacterium]|jgi:electron transfer flavoprotein alpha subunit|nr:electron transfer flavoprotein subunit alpha/FixB family protein [Flavobacteriales bacterium]|tara:strand:- start:8303 stop:9253 length:951 start_codon:yes stop_codon:yes gene_type:complete